MKIHIDWLGDFVDVPPLDQLVLKLTQAGIEVEGIENPAAASVGVVVGEVKDVAEHTDSDHLSVCQVDDGSRVYPVVCGASNVARGQRVPLARVGAKLQGLSIERRRVRGVHSEGMICSRQELGLEERSEGIWVLPTDAPLGKPIFEAYPASPVLELSITPNRPDLLSHEGVAREVAAAFGVRMRARSWRPSEVGAESNSLARVVVEEPKRCSSYMARVVEDVQVGPSPDWLQERLRRIGQRSVNNIVDATNYVLFELGQPLHAFDLGQIAKRSGQPTIVVRQAGPEEALETLDGVERSLDPDDLVIADARRAVALGGVMGGANSEVTEGTHAIILESAFFEPAGVRRTSRRYGLRSESSHRFERTVDRQGVGRALDRCAQLIAEIAGGRIAKGRIEVVQKQEPPQDVPLNLERLKNLLGLKLSAELVVQMLDPLGIRCLTRTDLALRFEVPSFRPDLTREADLIEEVARRYGYDNIPESLPDAGGHYLNEPLEDARIDRLGQLMRSLGISEAVTHGFGSPQDFAPLSEREGLPITIQNPLGEDLSAMRTSLWPGLLKSVLRNLRQGQRNIRLFEIGTTFHQRTPGENEDERSRGLPLERHRLAFLMVGGRFGGRWFEHAADVDVGDAVGAVEAVLETVAYAGKLQRKPATLGGMHPHAAGEVWLDDRPIGIVGELHPGWMRDLEIAAPVVGAELDLDALLASDAATLRYRPLGKFPGTRRDVSVLAPRAQTYEEIRAFIRAQAGSELGDDVVESVRLFDVYSGKPVPADKVSLAFAIDYRHPDRTLTDAEVGKSFDLVIAKLRSELGLEIRD